MYKCPQFSEDFIEAENDEDGENDENPEPLFEQLDADPIEKPASTKAPEVVPNPAVVRSWPNRIDAAQKSGIVRMLDNVASSLIYIMRPICALTNKVRILKSYLQNLGAMK